MARTLTGDIGAPGFFHQSLVAADDVFGVPCSLSEMMILVPKKRTVGALLINKQQSKREEEREAVPSPRGHENSVACFSKTSPTTFTILGTMLEKDINVKSIGVNLWLICYESRYRRPTFCYSRPHA